MTPSYFRFASRDKKTDLHLLAYLKRLETVFESQSMNDIVYHCRQRTTTGPLDCIMLNTGLTVPSMAACVVPCVAPCVPD